MPNVDDDLNPACGPDPANVDARAEQGRPKLSEAAKRALAEARARASDAVFEQNPPELEGRGGLNPVRYGDWEVKGLASDF